jgi:hypothetical protein
LLRETAEWRSVVRQIQTKVQWLIAFFTLGAGAFGALVLGSRDIGLILSFYAFCRCRLGGRFVRG